MNWGCIACASLRPCRYAAPLRGRPMRSAGYAPIEENCRCVVLTQTINHFTYQINQQETPRNFNNEWDIPHPDLVKHLMWIRDNLLKRGDLYFTRAKNISNGKDKRFVTKNQCLITVFPKFIKIGIVLFGIRM